MTYRRRLKINNQYNCGTTVEESIIPQNLKPFKKAIQCASTAINSRPKSFYDALRTPAQDIARREGQIVGGNTVVIDDGVTGGRGDLEAVGAVKEPGAATEVYRGGVQGAAGG